MRALKTEQSRPRGEYWRELIAQQEQSDLTIHAFCAQQGVTEASFYHWRKQLRNSAPVCFALVEHSVDSLRRNAPVEVLLPSGERLQIAPGADATTLRMVLAVLRERV
jgi:hypothetical protein